MGLEEFVALIGFEGLAMPFLGRMNFSKNVWF